MNKNMIELPFVNEFDSKEIAKARAVFRLDKDKFIEQIREMDDTELANEILKHPEMGEFIFPFVDDLSAFYDEINEYYIPDSEVVSDEEARLNRWVPTVLRQIKRYVREELHYKDFDEYDEARYNKIQYKNFLRNLEDMISFGYSPEEVIEFCEEQGYNFDDLYDATSLRDAYESNNIDYSIGDITKAIETSRQAKTPLQQREAELASLEAEAKTITEAEALVDKQNARQGEQK